jgi:MoaA/NifB/PqqE/SkfB family radical SAM enzyme
MGSRASFSNHTTRADHGRCHDAATPVPAKHTKGRGPWLGQRLLYSPFLAQLVVIRRCNLACGYCSEFDESSPPVPSEALRARIDRLKELGTFSLELTGGEPMLHPEIYDLVAYARRRDFYKVMMISNAYLLSEAKVRRLNDAGLMELQVSVDGVQPNDVTVKVLKPLLPKLEMLARSARFKVVLSAVLGSCPPKEALEVVHTARRLGFRPRVLVLHDQHGQMRLDADERATLQQLRRELGRGFREASDYRLRILQSGAAPFKCRAGSRYLYVDELGDVAWCSQTRAGSPCRWAEDYWNATSAKLRSLRLCS